MRKALTAFMPKLLWETGCRGVSVAVGDAFGVRMAWPFGKGTMHTAVEVPCFGQVLGAVALLKLHQDGKLDLDAEVSGARHLRTGANATVRDVLIGDVSLASETAMGLVEAVTRRRLSGYALEHLYRPLGMEKTDINAIGGAVTTAWDQALLLDALLRPHPGTRRTILSAKTVEVMVTPVGEAVTPDGVRRALGVDVGQAGQELEWFGSGGHSPRDVDAAGRAYPGIGISVAVVCVGSQRGVADRVIEHVATTAHAMLVAERAVVESGQAA